MATFRRYRSYILVFGSCAFAACGDGVVPGQGVARLGPAGGTVSLGAMIRVEVPAGALGREETVTVAQLMEPPAEGVTAASKLFAVAFASSPADPDGVYVGLEGGLIRIEGANLNRVRRSNSAP